MTPTLRALFTFEFTRQVKNRHYLLVMSGFILTFLLLATLGMGQAASQPAVAIGLWWLAVLVALQIAIPAFVVQDEASGTLLQLQLLAVPEEGMLLAKSAALWLALMLPVALLTMPMGLAAGLPPGMIIRTALLLLPASWSFWLISATASLLLLGSARAAALQLLIALPLAVPIMIFGAASSTALAEMQTQAALLLSGIAFATTALCPWAMAFLLRTHRAG